MSFRVASQKLVRGALPSCRGSRLHGVTLEPGVLICGDGVG
ncbi:MAG TPA: hypothetical protein VHV99_13250 [Paraburkholderia sp.]|nr:hypothetical protein [Paraburkholderia sp.]